ncbi:hypothetical protein DTO164E3_1184 [Paecilomyces variotii]|nr:hypothetical protein DTO164E3_1184 [Paecilomyces variotii]KAJ9226945.1 hypothetical protein DTO169C6_700 [Paecilomyces variotii]KAJ9262615.1 hypothetical protein DTO195F2_3336 [Paecilomyces variotii]KAJ9286081.1 hypothetical protein DTO021C3_6326 [Paecilomyces variotii]KAJ9325637.1 hypothetical protein DTO027B3_3281 [Paecilomyces variotii]
MENLITPMGIPGNNNNISYDRNNIEYNMSTTKTLQCIYMTINTAITPHNRGRRKRDSFRLSSSHSTS